MSAVLQNTPVLIGGQGKVMTLEARRFIDFSYLFLPLLALRVMLPIKVAKIEMWTESVAWAVFFLSKSFLCTFSDVFFILAVVVWSFISFPRINLFLLVLKD